MSSDDERVARLERRVERVIGLLRFVVAMALAGIGLFATAWLGSRGHLLLAGLLWLPGAAAVWAFDKALHEYLAHGR